MCQTCPEEPWRLYVSAFADVADPAASKWMGQCSWTRSPGNTALVDGLCTCVLAYYIHTTYAIAVYIWDTYISLEEQDDLE